MTILYIAGLSHSGSTLTTRLLNEHSDVFAPGEMIYLHTLFGEGREDEILCRCESISAWNCDFWNGELLSSIREINDEIWKMTKVDPYPPREWIKSLSGVYPESNGQDFIDMNRKLFELIRTETGSSIIIDSSKTLWRLLPLYRNLGEEIKVLHVIKSPENQIGSRYKRDMNSFFRSAIIKYWRRNYLYEYFFDNDDRYKKVRFETLARDFDSTMSSIHEWLGLDHEPPLEGEPSPWHHLGGSNPDLVRPDPDRIEKEFNPTYLQRFVMDALERLY